MELTFRPATAADSDLLADLVLGEAEQETTRVAMALYGIPEFGVARDLFRLLWRAGANWRHSQVVSIDGTPAGVLQTEGSSVRVTPRIVITALLQLGPVRLLRMRSRSALYRRVTPEKPAGSCVIREIHVAPEFRDRGLGEAIMEHAEEDARDRGFSTVALHTLATNPARRFYERRGFELAGERSDPEFERITGCPGNVLYVKRL
jgi:ribosomal protein S18 acetylase RimI-like enzyme